MRQLCASLDWPDGRVEREMRVGIELLIDTGRRPDEACELAYDCLAFDNDGKPVLIYGNSKENRPQRQLPLHRATADLIRVQQARVRSRYPHTPVAELKLLPSVIRNPRGRKAISADSLLPGGNRLLPARPPSPGGLIDGGRAQWSLAWLCVPPLEHPERDGEHDGGEHHENTGLDALERPEPAGRLISHEPPVAVRHQAGQGVGFEA
jgi:hypothetical protein